MSPALEPVHQLAREVRRHGGALFAGVPEPHDELMSLVWGPRFDREHALGLVARRPATALPAVTALLAAADAFDALHVPAQQRLRQLIRRHRALNGPVVESVEMQGRAAVPEAWGAAPVRNDGAHAAARGLPM